MIIPVRCFTCGKVNREYEEEAREGVEAPWEIWGRDGKEEVQMRRN